MPVNFKASDEDYTLIDGIVGRAVMMAERNGQALPNDRLQLTMDLCACHLNGCPLKLAELLQADDFNFAHDVWGIRRHMNRTTGKLADCFLPRFADLKEDCAVADKPTPEQAAAVRRFAELYGGRWKAELHICWRNSSYPRSPEADRPLLQQVRNQFGPQWLETVTLKDLED